MHTRIIVRPALATALLLLLPVVAMQFSDRLVWDLADFIAAGTLLFGAGVTYELIARRSVDATHRIAIALAVAGALALIWTNLAVGIIGSEDYTANVMYVGVLAVGVLGAVIARFRPHGMARALFAMAVSQALVPIIALVVWKPGFASPVTLWAMLTMNLVFVILFVASALLFRQAGRHLQAGA